MSKENPGRLRLFVRGRIAKAREKTSRGALWSGHKFIVAAEGTTATAGVMDIGTQYQPQRILGEGIWNAITHLNASEISHAARQLLTSVEAHPDRLIPIAALGVVTVIGEAGRRIVRSRLRR